MENLRWLANTLQEEAVEIWPVLAVILLGATVSAIRTALRPDERSIVTPLRVGWFFPAGLLGSALLLSWVPGMSGDSKVGGLIGIALAPLMLLAHAIWAVVRLVKARGGRVAAIGTLTSQLVTTFFVCGPAMGLASGFGRTWH